MFHLVYLSSAVQPFAEQELREFLEKTRSSNAQHEITGILLYHSGNIIQVLEGEEEVVRSLFARIERDPRHKGVMVVIHEAIAEREFPDWSMAYRDLSQESGSSLPGFNQFLNTLAAADECFKNPTKVRTLLRIFKAQMR